jgi:hypothetical protein
MAETYQFWFRRKYNLPPSDPRFLALTPEDVEAEYWAYEYAEAGGKEEFEDDDFDEIENIDDIQSFDEWETLINES